MSSITMTATETAAEASAYSVLLKMPSFAEIKKRVSTLIADMQSSGLFSLEICQELSTWEKAYQEKYLKSLSTKADREAASYGLCYLLCEAIEPAYASHKEDMDKLLQLQGFKERIRELLEATLPEKSTVGAFLKAYRKKSDMESLEKAKTEKIAAFFEQQLKTLNAQFAETDKSLVESFEALIKRLQGINAQRKTMSKDLTELLVALNEKVAQISTKLIKNATKAEDIGRKMEAQVAVISRNLKRFEDILQKKE